MTLFGQVLFTSLRKETDNDNLDTQMLIFFSS